MNPEAGSTKVANACIGKNALHLIAETIKSVFSFRFLLLQFFYLLKFQLCFFHPFRLEITRHAEDQQKGDGDESGEDQQIPPCLMGRTRRFQNKKTILVSSPKRDQNKTKQNGETPL